MSERREAEGSKTHAEVGHASGDVVVELVDVAHDGHHGNDASCKEKND